MFKSVDKSLSQIRSRPIPELNIYEYKGVWAGGGKSLEKSDKRLKWLGIQFSRMRIRAVFGADADISHAIKELVYTYGK